MDFPDLSSEVLELASRNCDGYSLAELIEAGKEAGIPQEIIEKAYIKVENRRKQRKIRNKKISQASCAIALGIALWSGLTYNSCQMARVEMEKAKAELNNQIQRRSQLVPKLARLPKDRADRSLSYEIIGSENRIAVAKKRYCDRVIAYNSQINQFPAHIIANIWVFTDARCDV